MIMFNTEKVMELLKNDPELLVKFDSFVCKYKSPYNEASKLKGIPNTPEALAMVDLYRKLILRTNGLIHSYGSLIGNITKFTVRLKARGANRKARGGNGQSIPHANADTFALYHHLDY